jgi:hypothetical protein
MRQSTAPVSGCEPTPARAAEPTRPPSSRASSRGSTWLSAPLRVMRSWVHCASALKVGSGVGPGAGAGAGAAMPAARDGACGAARSAAAGGAALTEGEAGATGSGAMTGGHCTGGGSGGSAFILTASSRASACWARSTALSAASVASRSAAAWRACRSRSRSRSSSARLADSVTARDSASAVSSTLGAGGGGDASAGLGAGVTGAGGAAGTGAAGRSCIGASGATPGTGSRCHITVTSTPTSTVAKAAFHGMREPAPPPMPSSRCHHGRSAPTGPAGSDGATASWASTRMD